MSNEAAALPILDDLIVALFQRARELGLVPEPASKLLTKEALADYYGVPARTVRTWREHGCPGHKLGQKVMYDVAEVDAWIRDGRVA